jgi:hypothetical protein
MASNRNRTISVRLTDDELAAWQVAAEDKDLPIATLIRHIVNAHLKTKGAGDAEE